MVMSILMVWAFTIPDNIDCQTHLFNSDNRFPNL